MVGPTKLKPAFQRAAHGLGLGRDRRHLIQALEAVDLRFAADEGPDEPYRILQLQPGTRVAARRLELAPVADDAGILHALFDLGIAHARQALGIEAEQHLPVALALAQYGDPGKPA